MYKHQAWHTYNIRDKYIMSNQNKKKLEKQDKEEKQNNPQMARDSRHKYVRSKSLKAMSAHPYSTKALDQYHKFTEPREANDDDEGVNRHKKERRKHKHSP